MSDAANPHGGISDKFDAFLREIVHDHREAGLVAIAGAFVGSGISLLIDADATDEQIRNMLEMRLTFERDNRKPKTPAASLAVPASPGAKA